jgi:UDP-4-amino-4-deoxy-L-arabinose-oxoglutarate aminotransferase
MILQGNRAENSLLEPEKKKVEYYRHNLQSSDKEELLKVLDSTFLTTGSLTKQFEKSFARYLNTSFAVGVMSCTHALELCLRYFNIGAGDEVITTPLSYVATANAIESVGAKPVFVDVEPLTGNIDANLIEQAITSSTKAIIPVHLYGQMCDMKKIKAIADAYKLSIIEDAAHCVEGIRDGHKPGSLSDAACFSFYATKNITSGEGGAIATNSKEMDEWLRKARSHGLSSNAADRYSKKYCHYDMEFLGMKCNMTNIQAALLIHQLERIDSLHEKREDLWNYYSVQLTQIKKPTTIRNSKHAYHVFTIWSDQRDDMLLHMQDYQVGVAVHYQAIHTMHYYKQKYGYINDDFSNAYQIGKNTLTLPLYPLLSKNQVDYVCDVTKLF